jgi:arylsulfatase
MYYSTGCSHAPHHVPREWSDKYKGKFDQGWDVLREETLARQKELGVFPPTPSCRRTTPFPKWDSLSETEKRLYARQMETYAGYSENADWNVGRVLAAIEELGELDNTLVIWIWGDNGASLEGTLSGTFNELTTMNGIPLTAEQQMGLCSSTAGSRPGAATDGARTIRRRGPGRATALRLGQAGRVPSRRHAQSARRRYPKAIADPGGLRSHFTHVIDIAPTVLEIAGIPAPTHVDGIEQEPLHGFTFADSLSDANAPERHTQQYFEAVGNRAMYKDGWWLAMRLPRIPWLLDPEALRKFGPGLGSGRRPVELYYLPDDFSQARNSPTSIRRRSRSCAGSSGRRPSATRCCRSSAGSPPSTGSCRRSQGLEVHLPRAIENVAAGMIPASTTTRTRSAPTSSSRTAAPRA